MQEYLTLLDSALQSEVGLAVLCSSVESADKLRQVLYMARAKAREVGLKQYDVLSMSISPHAGDILYIYKRKADAQDGTTHDKDDAEAVR